MEVVVFIVLAVAIYGLPLYIAWYKNNKCVHLIGALLIVVPYILPVLWFVLLAWSIMMSKEEKTIDKQ